MSRGDFQDLDPRRRALTDAGCNVTAIGGVTYGYDGRNMLSRYAGGYVYNDPLDRLFDVSGERRWMMRSGDEVLSEIGYDGLLKRRYVHGPGIDEPLVWYEGAGAGDRRYLHADERGSVVAVTNGAGSATAINSYDEYGRPGAANQGRFGYTGQKWIADLGLYDYKARMYAPQPGRFMQTDPTGYADGMNLYGYVGGDPVNNTDPSGLNDFKVTAPSCGAGSQLSSTGDDKYGINTGYVCLNFFDLDGLRSREGLAGGGREGGSFTPGSSRNTPQDKQCKMDPRLAKGREFFDSLSDWSGNTANGLALAGAVPTPATPALVAFAGIAKGVSLVATGSQLLIDGVHYARTGDARPFASDFGSAVLGAIQAGKLAGRLTGYAGSRPGGSADKVGQAATDVLYGAGSGALNLGC